MNNCPFCLLEGRVFSPQSEGQDGGIALRVEDAQGSSNLTYCTFS